MKRSLIFLLLLSLTGCWQFIFGSGGGGGGGGPTGPPQGTALARVEVTPINQKLGYPVTVKFIVSAPRGPVTLNFVSSQRYDFEIFDSKGERAFKWSEGKFFGQALGTEKVTEGAPLVWYDSWLPITSGSYRVEARVTSSTVLNATASFTVVP